MGSWHTGGGHRFCICGFSCTHHCKPRTPAARPSAQARSPVRRRRAEAGAQKPPRRREGAPLPTCTSSTCGPPSMTSQQSGKSWVAGQCGPRVSNKSFAARRRACSGCWGTPHLVLPLRFARHARRACIPCVAGSLGYVYQSGKACRTCGLLRKPAARQPGCALRQPNGVPSEVGCARFDMGAERRTPQRNHH